MAVQIENVAIPVNLSAFVLTPECANDLGPSRIGIIAQPNYMGLRLDEALMQHDLVDHVDFHNTAPAKLNPRITDIGADVWDANPPKYRRNRLGIYLHWTLPRMYRAAQAQENQGKSHGERSDTQEDDLSTPQFPSVPNRWLVARRLNHQVSEDGKTLPQFQTWIVESNRVRRIQDIPDTVDIEVEVSPFIRGNIDPNDPDWRTVLEQQAELCLGKRNEYSGWPEDEASWSEEERGIEGEDDFMTLTVLGSSNPVFPDYTPHNGSVFSIVDAFKYRGLDGSVKYLTEANADYFVIGWNSLSRSDLLAPSTPLQFRTTLKNLKLSLTPPEGASEEEKAKIETKFGPDFTMEPISAGVTPLDGVITFLRAHKGNSEIEQVFGDMDADEIAEMVLNLGDLLYAANDSFDERAKAQDINLYDALYGKSTSSGFRWEYAEKSAPGKPPKAPSKEQFDDLLNLNEKQARFDAYERKLQQLRWDLFAEWWKYVSDKSNIRDHIQDEYRARVEDLDRQIRDIESKSGGIRPVLTAALDNQSFKRIAEDPFFMRKEPTVCIAGMDSGWPKDFLDELPIRIESFFPQSIDGVEQTVFMGKPSPFPSRLNNIALKILKGCITTSGQNLPKSPMPSRGFQHWGTKNPFEPMFLEWEALYYHIDKSKWTVGIRPSPVGLPTSHVRYGIPELLSENTQNQKDFRYVTGRTLILPQPIFSLTTAVKAVLDSNDPNSPIKTDEDKKKLLDGIEKLTFMSCPLSGLQEHLTTRVMGTHVKPTVNLPGKTNVPLLPAVQTDIGFTENTLKLIDSRSNLTPYGNLLNFPAETYPQHPFKGVTHGQLMITKLNIIDKFGQAVALPAPKPKLKNPPAVPESIHPCMSDFVIPDIIDNKLNTVYPEDTPAEHGDWPLCRFMQLAPAINQNARLNASFLNPSPPGSSFPFWSETENDKPESPIFGWIVINYQDSGMQFFRPDGRFYREIRIGGPNNAVLGSKWLPFDPPTTPAETDVPSQLDGLIKKVIDVANQGTFLKSFVYMINNAIKAMPFAPAEYAGYANALVGKPLALVNVGFSLELSIPALHAHNTLGKRPEDEQIELCEYQFPVKIGDSERPFDGMVGYFETDNTADGSTNWNKIYSYSADPDNDEFFQLIPENFIKLSPHYIDPVSLNVSTSNPSGRAFSSYREARAAQYRILTMIVDPYTPIHAYSPILPITGLSLPAWTIQQAMSRMTAFFRLGPSLISVDVPAWYDEERKVDPDSWTTPLPDGAGKESPAFPTIRLPVSGKKGLWRWLQPYDVPGAMPTDAHDTRYNEMGVVQEDTRIRKDFAPYTYVEGYLQLARPLLTSDIVGNDGP
ncbi:hypothetical protein CC78DRAFT_527127 [Lojkania enalia]|uniref:Uncharacterized protein n=1 Tax=Lojkania enalia TaxID=147567 RepID=A0A9P4JVW2_9PLEO|nr:hypothetical protein CC78DRAFT_527127 [Didymosphaeria enalia]